MLDLKKYQKMNKDLQAGMEVMKDELAKEFVEGVSGGGAMRVVLNGNQEITEVHIKPEAVDPSDIQMLEDLFKAAVNQGLEKAKDLQDKRVGNLAGALKLPNLPFV